MLEKPSSCAGVNWLITRAKGARQKAKGKEALNLFMPLTSHPHLLNLLSLVPFSLELFSFEPSFPLAFILSPFSFNLSPLSFHLSPFTFPSSHMAIEKITG